MEPIQTPVSTEYKPDMQCLVMYIVTISTCEGMLQVIPSQGNVVDQQILRTPRFAVGLTQAKHFINTELPWWEAFPLSFPYEKKKNMLEIPLTAILP